MKKLLLVLLLAVGVSTIAEAQQKHDYSKTTYIKKRRQPKNLNPVEPGFQSIFDFSVTLPKRDMDDPAILADYVGGYRFNNMFFLGVGVGLGAAFDSDVNEEAHRYDNSDYLCYTKAEAYGFTYRLYIQGRVYLSKKRLQPFMSVSIGYEDCRVEKKHSSCSLIGGSWYESYHDYFLYAMPEVGLNYRITDRVGAFLSVGYGATIKNGGLQIKLGATF